MVTPSVQMVTMLVTQTAADPDQHLLEGPEIQNYQAHAAGPSISLDGPPKRR